MENENNLEQIVQEAVAPQDQGDIDESSQIDLEPTQEQEKAKTSPATPTLENNIRALREKAERIERERDELNRRLQEIENKKSPKQEEEEDFSINLGESDLAEGRHLTKLQKQMRKQQEELAKAQQQMQSLLVETRLKAEHPDIEKVVTGDNLKALSEMYPDIARMLNTSSDYYSKAKSAYTMIKKFGIHAEDNYSAEKEVIHKNLNKPRPVNSLSPQQGDSPLSRANAFANGLTDDLRKQLYKEMEEAIKNQ